MKKNRLYLFVLALSILSFQAKAEGQFIEPFVEVLAWKAAETNSSWATTLTFPTNSIHVIQSEPTFETHAGIRGGLQFSPGDHYWDTKLYYTYYANKSNSNISLGAQLVSSLFFSGSYFISQNLFFGGNADWSLMMNMLDLEISHTFHPTQALSLAPKIGLKGGSINQSININWNAVIYNATEKLNNNFSGIGPSFGLDAKLNLVNNFSLVSNISTALMYGHWNDDDVYQRPATFFTTPVTISSRASNSKLGTLMMDYFLGLEWQHHGKSNVSVKAGYEMQYWPSQLRLVAVQQLPTFGDLTFQGVTCAFSVDL